MFYSFLTTILFLSFKRSVYHNLFDNRFASGSGLNHIYPFREV